MSCQPVRGTRDLLEKELAQHHHLVEQAYRIMPLYGYQEIETPIFEYTSVFQRSLGEASDIVGKEMYTFLDRSGESITLRPEGTAAVTRAILSAGLTQTLPQKRFYKGPMFRHERPQKGRYRQFYQLGVECFGIAQSFVDVECIALANQLLQQWKIQDYTLTINTLGDQESRQAYRQALINYFRRYVQDLSHDSQLRLERNPLRIFDSKDPKDQALFPEAPAFEDFLNASSRQFFDQVLKGLQDLHIPFTHNQRLVRGIDYYCHTAFEFTVKGLEAAQNTVLAGGRYDGLMEQLGGPSLPGIGWACGLDRLALLLPPCLTPPSSLRIAVIAMGEEFQSVALQWAQTLRQQFFSVEMPFHGNVSKRLKAADKAGCQIALLFGEDEYKTHQVKVRHLMNDQLEKEKLVALSDIVSYLSSFRKA